MPESPADDLTLGALRQELRRLIAMADSAERPKPDVINPPEHGMPGYEWRIAGEVVPGVKPPMWVVRTVDDAESCDAVFLAQPDPYQPYDWAQYLDFAAMRPLEARRLAMSLLAAADRADHLSAGVPRLEDRRTA